VHSSKNNNSLVYNRKGFKIFHSACRFLGVEHKFLFLLDSNKLKYQSFSELATYMGPWSVNFFSVDLLYHSFHRV